MGRVSGWEALGVGAPGVRASAPECLSCPPVGVVAEREVPAAGEPAADAEHAGRAAEEGGRGEGEPVVAAGTVVPRTWGHILPVRGRTRSSAQGPPRAAKAPRERKEDKMTLLESGHSCVLSPVGLLGTLGPARSQRPWCQSVPPRARSPGYPLPKGRPARTPVRGVGRGAGFPGRPREAASWLVLDCRG